MMVDLPSVTHLPKYLSGLLLGTCGIIPCLGYAAWLVACMYQCLNHRQYRSPKRPTHNRGALSLRNMHITKDLRYR
jgi:sterol desaturase/sphingolipid hydroxylase (fatty acid hydroxylase superfamily)